MVMIWMSNFHMDVFELAASKSSLVAVNMVEYLLFQQCVYFHYLLAPSFYGIQYILQPFEWTL